jgi:tetratricopeptide (TPR) repeat protein
MARPLASRPPEPKPLREPGEPEVRSTGERLARLEAEARALGETPQAAPVHHAMGRLWMEKLGDPRSAAVCFQNAFSLDPRYRPTLEAARRLFASEGAWERALALHRQEEALVEDPEAKAESLRAQARILAAPPLSRTAEAARLVERALSFSPDHPGILEMAAEAAESSGDALGAVRLLLRAAAALKDDVHRAVFLRRALLRLRALRDRPTTASNGSPSLPGPGRVPAATAAAIEELLEESARRLHEADPDDPVAIMALAARARANGAWNELLQLSREEAERSGSAGARLLCAQLALYKLGNPTEALAEVQAGLELAPQDAGLRALQLELLATQRPEDLPGALAARASLATDPSERADSKVAAAALATGPQEQERLLSEALAENPRDAAAVALHVRLLAGRDAAAAAERFAALGQALEEHAPSEAAARYLEAAAWLTRAGRRLEAANLGARVLMLVPHQPAALRLLQRTLPPVGGSQKLARILEEAAEGAAAAAPAAAAELLSRAAALLADSPPASDPGASLPPGVSERPPPAHALKLMERAMALSRDQSGPRWMEAWTLLALRTGDLAALSRALEARAERAEGREAGDLIIEAAELARDAGDDARTADLLRRARKLDPEGAQARSLLLALPSLEAEERLDLLGEEARIAEPARAAGLQAERAALLELAGRADDAVQACALSLSLGGVDLAVLRRLLRLQLRRGDPAAALAVLEQIGHALPEGPARAEAHARAAELCEFRFSDEPRALELYALASAADPGAPLPLAAQARLRVWEGNASAAAALFGKLAAARSGKEKVFALRWAAALRAHQTSADGKAAAHYRALLAEEPGDLPAMAALLELPAAGADKASLRERAELRGRLAGYCQDPRVSALLRARAAEDRLAAGERDQGIADYRRALALNPQDRFSLDAVEEALRAGGERRQLEDHLAFRCGCEEGRTRAALVLQRAELLAEDGRHDEAAAAQREALALDPGLRHAAVAMPQPVAPPRAAVLAQKPAPLPADVASQPQKPAQADKRTTVPPSVPPRSIAALRAQLASPALRPESFRTLSAAFGFAGQTDAAFCATAVLVGLGLATAAEKATYEAATAKAPPPELPPLGEATELAGEGDGGPARELLFGAAPAIARALPAEMAGRADRVKGDNPVQKLSGAIARALGLPRELALFAAKSEPGVVLATLTEPPGLLVGGEVPRRYPPRQQRFLYARALAQIRARSHGLVGLPAAQLLQIVAEVARACLPPGAPAPGLPPPATALGEKLRAALPEAARARLGPLALRVAREGVPSIDALALGLRETAERTALVICGDPGAAISIVAAECPGGLARPEVARLSRFAVSDAYFALRAR